MDKRREKMSSNVVIIISSDEDEEINKLDGIKVEPTKITPLTSGATNVKYDGISNVIIIDSDEDENTVERGTLENLHAIKQSSRCVKSCYKRKKPKGSINFNKDGSTLPLDFKSSSANPSFQIDRKRLKLLRNVIQSKLQKSPSTKLTVVKNEVTVKKFFIFRPTFPFPKAFYVISLIFLNCNYR